MMLKKVLPSLLTIATRVMSEYKLEPQAKEEPI
jgi:hypothetical protein